MHDGSVGAVTPQPKPIEAVRDWIFARYAGEYPEALPPVPTVRPGSASDQAFWTETLAGAGRPLHRLQRGGRDDRQTTIGDLATSVHGRADAQPVHRVVVDLRHNGGGNNRTYLPLLACPPCPRPRPAGPRPLLTGPATFSAAGNFVTELKVGPVSATGYASSESRPAAGSTCTAMSAWSPCRRATLSSSVSSRYHEKAPGDDPPEYRGRMSRSS